VIIVLEILLEKDKIIIPEDARPLVWYGMRKKEIFNFYSQYLNPILSIDNGNIIVDWKKRHKIISECNRHQAEGVDQFINSTLLALGILTQEPEGAWSFLDKELNPIWGMPDNNYNVPCYPGRIGQAFFKREADIDNYSQQLKKSHKDLTIFMMTRVKQGAHA
jgi:hypothetical protein